MQRAEPHVYSAITRDIRVNALPFYVEEQSRPEDFHFVWAYAIQVENHGEQTVQLINRHWKITDANGKLEEVRGPGVIGEQPTLKPGEAFQYTSGCVLTTPSGMMVGQYEMQLKDGETFWIDIPAFSLDLPDMLISMN